MGKVYKSLPYYRIEHSTKVNRRTINRPTMVSMDDPATMVMTDFHDMIPFSIDTTASIDAGNDKMIACGVRLLFVTDKSGELLGLVTATDILGEKPVRYLNEHGGSRADIMIKDIMTPKSELDVLYMHDISNACVGDIAETMRTFARQHVLVVEKLADGKEELRGMFSTSQIGRQTGASIELSQRASSFADLEKAIMTA